MEELIDILNDVEEEELEIRAPIRRAPTKIRKRINQFDKWDDVEFFNRFSLSKGTADLVLDLTRHMIKTKTMKNRAISPEVVVRNKNTLHCHETHPADGCPVRLTSPVPAESSRSGTELFLLVALCASLALLAYTNWRPIEKQWRPLVDALSHKVQYTNIGRHEDQEMNV